MKNQKGNPNQIKPNELRIGNIISCSDGTHHAVSKFGNYKVRLGRITNQHGVKCWITSNIEDVAPIPLTEELLLKCGFEPIPHFTVANSHTIGLGRGRVLSIGNTENANQMAWIQSVEGSAVTDLICVHNFDYDGKMHLHQLQNLYFALTGEELKIEL